MKKKLLIALCLGIAVVACHKDDSVAPAKQKSSYTTHGAGRLSVSLTDTVNSRFIPMSVANEMIGSYLSSINASANDTDIQSFSINADSLRMYLANTSVKSVKLMLAHTMNYINAGNYGINAGYQSGAMTIVIAAYDASGNYVYYNAGTGACVLDHLLPCPYSCPPGNASSNILQ